MLLKVLRCASKSSEVFLKFRVFLKFWGGYKVPEMLLEELEDALLGAERTAMGNVPELGFEERVGPL